MCSIHLFFLYYICFRMHHVSYFQMCGFIWKLCPEQLLGYCVHHTLHPQNLPNNLTCSCHQSLAMDTQHLTLSALATQGTACAWPPTVSALHVRFSSCASGLGSIPMLLHPIHSSSLKVFVLADGLTYKHSDSWPICTQDARLPEIWLSLGAPDEAGTDTTDFESDRLQLASVTNSKVTLGRSIDIFSFILIKYRQQVMEASAQKIH